MVPARVLSALLLIAACGDAAAPSAADTGDLTTGDTTTSPSPTTGSLEPTTTSTDDATSEAPEQPVCCGCLCVDPRWSCSADTCLYADGTAAALAPEAGFLAQPAHDFTFYGDGEQFDQHAPEARIWYAFRPADTAPESRPVAVFFNGGPPYSSSTLFGLGTNAVSLDPDIAGDARVAPNPHSWTRFANVLYIDPRNSGYSYDVAPDPTAAELLQFTAEHDAADYVRTVLAFLARHPQLQKNRVILVGESYGGNRSALMLGMFMRPGRLLEKTRYHDPTLRDALLAHYAAVFPDAPTLSPELIATQFGHQVLVQPAVTWLSSPTSPTSDAEQDAALGCLAVDSDDDDPAQCDELYGWTGVRTNASVAALTDPTTLGPALGVTDPTTIAWLHADARADMIPRGLNINPPDETSLRAVFGELPDGESYYYPYGASASDLFNWQHVSYGYSYLESFNYARTFITDAGKDTVVYTPDIPAHIAGYENVIASATHVDAPVPGEARPGRILLRYAPGLLPGDPTIEIRFPHYPDAGHVVTLKSSGELADDVCRWFSDECPLP